MFPTGHHTLNDGERVRYHERLAAPWWLWGVALGASLAAAAEIHLGYGGNATWIAYLVAPAIAVAALLWLGRIRLTVTDDALRIDDTYLPLGAIAAVTPLSGKAKREALGQELDPEAFVIHRPWISRAALIELSDPSDPTPCWVISLRRPAALATMIAARTTRPGAAP